MRNLPAVIDRPAEDAPSPTSRRARRVKVRLAPTSNEFRARHPGALISTFDVDCDTWRHLVALYRWRRRERRLDPVDVRGLIWFAAKAGQS